MSALAELARTVASTAAGARPVLVGIAGAVAVGKSTTAALLRDELASLGVAAEVLCTDCFLFPNDELSARGLTMRKGFPETFNGDRVAACLDALRAGAPEVSVPVYSHATYDIVPGESRTISNRDVVIVEGVNVLWSPVRERLHIAVYIDADEAHVRRWFLSRFDELCRDPEPDSFYRGLAALEPESRRALAETAWDAINVVNLHEHIAPSRGAATHVFEKDGDHRAVRFTPRSGRRSAPRP